MKANRVESLTRLLTGLVLIATFWRRQAGSQTAPSPDSQSSKGQRQALDKARPAEAPFILKNYGARGRGRGRSHRPA